MTLSLDQTVFSKSKKVLSPSKALAMQKKLSQKGNEFWHYRREFILLLVAFRKAGAWAITPEHHTRFSAWCRWASETKLLPFKAGTIQCMACPRYIERTVTFQTKRERMRLQQKIEVHGAPARLLRRATTLLQGKLWPRRISHNDAAGQVAKDWISFQGKAFQKKAA